MENELQNTLTTANKEDLDTLTVKVEAATEEMGKSKSKDEVIKARKKEFNEHLVAALRQEYPNEDLKREERLIKGLFGKIIKSQTDLDATDKDNNISAGYIRKKVEEMVMLIYAFRYFKYNDINKIFESYGIKLDYQPVEEHLKYLAGTNFKDTLKAFVDECIDLAEQKDTIKHNIEENLFNEIPPTLRYNKDVNPAGIKKSVFKKFSLLNLLKKINLFKAKRKYEKMIEESNTRDKADTLAISIADTLVSEGKEVI